MLKIEMLKMPKPSSLWHDYLTYILSTCIGNVVEHENSGILPSAFAYLLELDSVNEEQLHLGGRKETTTCHLRNQGKLTHAGACRP